MAAIRCGMKTRRSILADPIPAIGHDQRIGTPPLVSSGKPNSALGATAASCSACAHVSPAIRCAVAMQRGRLMVPVDLYAPTKGAKAALAWEYVQQANAPENLLWLPENAAGC